MFIHGVIKRGLRGTNTDGTRCSKRSFKVVRNSFAFSIPTELYERLTRL